MNTLIHIYKRFYIIVSLKIITSANHKGGVSKTTSTASIGLVWHVWARKSWLIDLDGQANLTLYFIPNEDEAGKYLDSG